MPEDASQLTCEEFQSQISSLSFKSFADFVNHPHIKTCVICRSLLKEIEDLTDAARYRHPLSDDWSEST